MALKLMYITNQPDVASVIEEAGVDRIFVDLEWIGKTERQGGMDTVQSRHSIEDIKAVRAVIKKAELLVRCNIIHDKGEEYGSTEDEINAIVDAGADVIMLPFFKSPGEVKRFLTAVNGRVRTMLLVETPEAVSCIDEILALEGIDEVFVGLNDLSLGYKKKFMFELLADGTVESLCRKFADINIPYGFGGIAAPGKGALPAEFIIREHYRLGSSCAILSRSFCNMANIESTQELRQLFEEGVAAIRGVESECEMHRNFFTDNRKELLERVCAICAQ